MSKSSKSQSPSPAAETTDFDSSSFKKEMDSKMSSHINEKSSSSSSPSSSNPVRGTSTSSSSSSSSPSPSSLTLTERQALSTTYRLEGNEYFKNSDFPSASDKYLLSMQMDPLNVSVYTNLGICYLKMNQPSECIKILRVALALDNNNLKALLRISQAEKDSNNMERAVMYSAKAVSIAESLGNSQSPQWIETSNFLANLKKHYGEDKVQKIIEKSTKEKFKSIEITENEKENAKKIREQMENKSNNSSSSASPSPSSTTSSSSSTVSPPPSSTPIVPTGPPLPPINLKIQTLLKSSKAAGVLHHNAGKYELAIAEYEKGLKRYEEEERKVLEEGKIHSEELELMYAMELVSLHSNISLSYSQLQQTSPILHHSMLAISICEHSLQSNRISLSPADRLSLQSIWEKNLIRRSLAFETNGSYPSAWKEINKIPSMSISPQSTAWPHYQRIRNSYLNYQLHSGRDQKDKGNTAFKAQQYDVAVAAYKESFRFLDDVDSNRGMFSLSPVQSKEMREIKEMLYNNLSVCLIKLKQYDDAISWTQKGMDLNDKNWKAFWRRGIALLEKGEGEEAAKYLKKSIAIGGKEMGATKQEIEGLIANAEALKK